jgi:CBS domain-containing protein
MKCAELMKSDVVCAHVDQTSYEASQEMARANVGFLPVCNEDGLLVGVVTDRDLVLRVIAAGKDARQVRVHVAASTDLITCAPDDDLAVAEAKMVDAHVSRIAVVDAASHCVGVISLSDIAQVERGAQASEVLKRVSAREATPRAH